MAVKSGHSNKGNIHVRRLKAAYVEMKRHTAEYSLLDQRINEENLKPKAKKKLAQYKKRHSSC
jgi:hypothetical protein